MYGQVDLNEWYNNYYWVVSTYSNSATRRMRCRVFVSDSLFTVFKSGDDIKAFGTVNSYSIYTSSSNTVNLNWFNGHINIAEPTLSNQTEPLVTTDNSETFSAIFSNFDIKYTNGNTFLSATNPKIVPPALTNTQTDLENLSFNNFNIEAHSYSNQDVYMFFYNRSLTNSLTTDGLYPISTKLLTREAIYYDTTNSTEENAIYNVPIWKTGVLFNVGSTYEIKFAIINDFDDESNTPLYSYIGDTYNFTISSSVTQDYINQLNQQTATDTSQENFDNIQNSINNQSQSIDNMNNTISDSSVDTSSIDLPTDNTQDPTQSRC